MTTMKNMLLRWFRFGQNIHRVPRRKMTAKIKKIYKFDDEKKKIFFLFLWKAHTIFLYVCVRCTHSTHTHTIWRENHIKWLHMARIYGNTDTYTDIKKYTTKSKCISSFFLRKLSHSRLFVIWSWCVVWQCLSLLVHASKTHGLFF